MWWQDNKALGTTFAVIPVLFLVGSTTSLNAQENRKPELAARELFYSAVKTPAPAAAPAAVVAPPSAPPAVKPARPGRQSPSNPDIAAVETRPTHSAAPAPVGNTEVADRTQIIPASATISAVSLVPDSSRASGTALGLKYTVLKQVGDEMIEVPADTVFRAGDKIRISVETNQPGYLYIINRGSSGKWNPLFPSSAVADGNNYVEGFRDYTMPPKARMVFDTNRGTEKLFLVFSREPEPNLENVLYSLTTPASDTTAPPARTKTLVASNRLTIDDSTIDILRTANSRDLVIEKVTDQPVGEKKETAVYVVNPKGASGSRVVADLTLVHE